MSKQSGCASVFASSSAQERKNRRNITVYDYRNQNNVTKKLMETSGWDFNVFLGRLRQVFAINSQELFVLTTTDRTVLDYDKFRKLQDGTTVYLLQTKNQALQVAAVEEITFMPHYDTLIRSGMYEYYASEGQNPLPYALAELIDNSLSATAKNKGTRTIEIQMMFNETLGKPAVIVLDNGCGMTPQKLNNWAVYRLSKFTRQNSLFASNEEGYVRPKPVHRSLNSDISFFGVGGKQAVFYIGTSTMIISKSVASPDVHELVLSKEDFERKEKNKEEIYKTTIRNRKPGDFSHMNKTNELFLRDLISEELGKGSFTAVVITGVQPDHIKYLKQDFQEWTRRLAHIYHYYIHGVNGNVRDNPGTSSSTNSELPKIDIQITLREKPPKIPHVMNLREVEDDMQSRYIDAAADTFEFKASIEPDRGTVEGILRYHPFLYDKETYPKEPSAKEARGNRPIFECFWNGRLIPYTRINELDWFARPRGGDLPPPECYSRFSGVLFTDDKLEVSTNKLTFTDLELKLKKKETIFTYTVNGQKSVRSDIQKEFTQWLKNCHARLDKQVKFLCYKETITRADVAVKKMKHPWATFSTIECGSKMYKAGQLVSICFYVLFYNGRVIRFLLYGDHKEDAFATGGEVEITLQLEVILIPHRLQLYWPENNCWSQNDVRPAGTQLGPLRIEILNKKGESMSRIPTVGKAEVIKLSVKLRVVHHGKESVNLVAQYSSKWGFWFNKIENLTKLGNYTLFLNAMINERNEMFVSLMIFILSKMTLPGLKKAKQTIKISLLPGPPHSLHVKPDDSPVTVENGNPLKFNVEIHDEAGNITVGPKHVVRCQVQGLPPVTIDCSSTGAGQVVTKPINLKIFNGESQKLKVQLNIPRSIPMVAWELTVMPSTRVCLMELCSQDDKKLVLTNNERIDWLAGGVLENLFYKLYNESGKEVALTPEIASRIKVNWAGDLCIEDLVQGKLPDVQVPQRAQEAHFYQVSYQDQSVSVSFKITSHSVSVAGVCFQGGAPGSREISFIYGTFVGTVIVKLTAGDPAELKLISQPDQVIKSSAACSSLMCFTGHYQLMFRGSFNHKPIPGPSVSLTVLPDPNKPVSLSVEYDTNARFPAKGTFPVFSVTVVSDEGSPITTFNPAAISMFLWEGVPTRGTSPVSNLSDRCSKPLENEKKDCFYFRDKEIPEQAGKYTIQFSLRIDEARVLDKQIPINVVANQPVKLGPDSPPPCPVVSNSKDIADRTLMENMTLRIMDAHGNPTGQDLNGMVVVSIKNSSGESDLLFEGGINRHRFNLVEGKIHIPVSKHASSDKLAADIDRFIKEKTAEAGEILKMSKRVCSIPHHFRGQQGVLGKVGHLAYVEDDAAAWVISWHISGDMDCVITRSTETAMRIYKDTQGIQQVMPLDTIFVFPGSRPLPHIRGGQALFDPPGNPVYARELLIFPNNKMECEIVFKNILGDTILIDNLESGNNYRKLVVQNKIPCPTILTRQGQRISAKGKFGGAQNKAPPMNTLRLFGSPPPHRYHALKEQIGDLVSQYQLALKKKEETEKEREDHLKMLKSPDTQKKKEQMDEQKKQLEMIERQLGRFVNLGVRAFLKCNIKSLHDGSDLKYADAHILRTG
uniref:SMC hinge domain-containing protein n=1 Tax=Anabas testudineus TaxID=64144 RepID=A0A7N6AJ06_ANATE